MTMLTTGTPAILAIGYDDGSKTLRVQMHSGATYDYLGVDRIIFEEFQRAEDKDDYLAANINHVYPYHRA